MPSPLSPAIVKQKPNTLPHDARTTASASDTGPTDIRTTLRSATNTARSKMSILKKESTAAAQEQGNEQIREGKQALQDKLNARHYFLKAISQWEREGENRSKTAELIKSAYYDQATNLSLDHLEHVELPEQIGELKQLKHLFVSPHIKSLSVNLPKEVSVSYIKESKTTRLRASTIQQLQQQSIKHQESVKSNSTQKHRIERWQSVKAEPPFIVILREWHRNGEKGESRAEAVHRILHADTYQLETLNLSYLGLKEIPAAITHLKQLKYLLVSPDLLHLPRELENMPALQVFNLDAKGHRSPRF